MQLVMLKEVVLVAAVVEVLQGDPQDPQSIRDVGGDL